jgi:2-polyprenyl-3-methyl-5-hydroxy-6-metoxy-1,4-benzoquinol methylase
MHLINYDDLPNISCPICASTSFTQVTVRFDTGRLVKCKECEHIYLNPTLTDDMLAAIYRDYHASDNETALMEIVDSWFNDPHGQYQYSLDLIEQEGGFSGKRVIEIGTGPGRFLYECLVRGALVTGLDISPEAVRLAKQYFSIDLIPKEAGQAIKDKTIPCNMFDYVFAFEIIEHVRNPQEFLLDLFQLTAPGGVLFISTPNFYLFNLMGSAASVVSKWPEHIHFFYPLSLQKCLERCGFESVTVTSLNPLTYADRKKQRLIRIPLVRTLWQELRGISFLYSAKNILFRQLDRRREEADDSCWNGTTLIGIARRPAR